MTDLYENVEVAVSRGDVEELFTFYKSSLYMGSVGVEIRNLINKETPYISKVNGYKPFHTFRELFEHHQDVTSPLRKMCISNNFILVTEDTKIPFEKEEFFRLLKSTTLSGVRAIFDIDTRNESMTIYHSANSIVKSPPKFCCVKTGKDLQFTLFAGEYTAGYRDDKIEVILTRTFNIIAQTDTIPDEIDRYFDPSVKLTDDLVSNNVLIIPGYKFTLEECIEYSLAKGYEGFASFDGIDKNGEYMHNKDRTDYYTSYLLCDLRGQLMQINFLTNDFTKIPYKEGYTKVIASSYSQFQYEENFELGENLSIIGY